MTLSFFYVVLFTIRDKLVFIVHYLKKGLLQTAQRREIAIMLLRSLDIRFKTVINLLECQFICM